MVMVELWTRDMVEEEEEVEVKRRRGGRGRRIAVNRNGWEEAVVVVEVLPVRDVMFDEERKEHDHEKEML